MERYYNDNWVNVVRNLNSDVHKGLYEYECTIRREEENNKINLPYTRGLFKISLELLKEKDLYIYLISIVFFLVERFYIMGLIVALLMIWNIAFKLHNDFFYEKEIEILENLNTAQVLVLREGIERLVETEELVKGDIVYFRKNSIIGADIRIIDSENLKVDERGVTGDVFIKEKDSVKIDRKVSSTSEITNMLFRGSIIKDGSGKGIVVEVGSETELGKLVKIVNKKDNKKDLVIRDLETSLLKILICLVLFHLVFVLIFPGNFNNKLDLLVQGIFSIISIGAPFIIIYYNKYLKNKILYEDKIEINNSSSLKLINNIKILFINKLGNITKKALYVDKLYTNEQIYNSNKIDSEDINIRRLIDISILCNNAKYNRDSDFIKGDIFETAYIKFGFENSIYKGTLDGKNRRRFEIAISNDRNIRTTVNKNKKGYRANVRGNLENIIDACTHILINGIEREITPEDIIKIKLADLDFAKEGLVTEGFAYRNFNYEPTIQENIESNLVFVGIIALDNPFIEDVVDDFDLIMKNSILPIVFTDNDKTSANVLGKRLTLINSEDQITSGVELEGLDDEEFIKIVSKTRIYCKVSPEIKNKIISLYSNDGYEFLIEGESLVDLSIVSLSKIGVIKGKISMLLRKIGDIYTEESTVKTFFNLKRRGDELRSAINRGLFSYGSIILSYLIFLNVQYFLSKEVLMSEYNILIMNLLILPGIILLNSIYGEEIKSSKQCIRALLYIIIPVLGVFISKKDYDFIFICTISLISILEGIINFKIFKKENLKAFKLILFILIGLGIFIAINMLIFKISIDIISLIIILWLILIFFIGDFITRKWR